MNIMFKSIELQGFRSIDKASITLNNQGIVIVKGINKYEENASSNGSGKSSIFEGIVYALFEETSSGEKTVENRILRNGFKIKLILDIDGITYTIYREGKNNKSNVILYKNDIDISARTKSDTNKLILQLIGISKSVFLDSIVLSQSVSTNLASLQPTARRERLEVLTNTDANVAVFKDKLKERQTFYEDQCNQLQNKIAELNGICTSLNEQKITIQSKINYINSQIEERNKLGNIDEINNQINGYTNQINEWQNEINEIEINITNIDNDINESRKTGDVYINQKQLINNDINNLNSKIQEYSNQINLLEYQNKQCDNEINRYRNEIEKVKNSDTCPTCGRKYDNVDDSHIQSVIKEYENNINIQNENHQLNNDKINNQYDNINEVNNQINDLKKKLVDIDNNINEFNNKLIEKDNNKKEFLQNKQFINNNITTYNNCIKDLEGRKEKINSFQIGNINEFKDMLNDIESKYLDTSNQINDLNNTLNDNMNYLNSTKHMLQLVVKEFRTYLLNNSIVYLNKVLEQYSISLFSNSGDIIRIDSENNKLDIYLGQAPYESLSGGEKTRVNIALLLAQKSLAQITGNISCNIIILDEILGYCDGHAEEVVIDLITKDLDSLESIYMISHKEIPIGYDKEIIIVKEPSGLSNVKSY